MFMASKNPHLLFFKGNKKHTSKITKDPRKSVFMNKKNRDNRK